MKPSVANILSNIKDSKNSSALREFQQQKIADVWRRAKKSKHYANLPSYSLQSFLSLEPVSRQALKESPSMFDAVELSEAIKYYETSGTTGTPTPTLRTRDDIEWNYSGVALQWGEIISNKDRSLTLLPSDIAPIGDLIAGVCEIIGAVNMRCFPYTQGIVTWDRIQALSGRYMPTLLWSSPGVLLQLMRVLKRRAVFKEFSDSITTIILLGEVVSPKLRKMLSREWQALVYNGSYGSTETGTIAASGADACLRVLEYSHYCEILTDNKILPLQSGLVGDLVITTLHAYARPLIRFNTGDRVRVHNRQKGGAYIDVLGRDDDCIDIEGKSFTAFDIENIVYEVSGITGYQLVLDDGKLRKVLLEKDVDCGAPPTKHHEEAQSCFVSSGIEVEISILDELPLSTKSGAGLKSWKKSNVTSV